METITLGQLLEAVNGKLLGEVTDLTAPIFQVGTDSRKITPGSLFVPLVGENFDGHAYIESALNEGAAGCLTAVEREKYLPNKFYVKVDETEIALGDLAAWYKSQFDIPFVAVTGSVGKTTAKDMLASVLSTRYNVLKTDGNFNNNIGLPLTLFRLEKSHQICILEMGMDKLGEIDYLANIVKPDIGVITNIGDAHIERLGSRENIFQAKCELLPHVKQDGLLVLDGDDQLLSTLRGHTPVSAVFFGHGEDMDYRAQITGGDGSSYVNCHLTTPHMDREVCIPALGEHMVYPALIATAVAEQFGLTPDQIEIGIRKFVPTRMRMNVLHRKDDITILDDTYNANPQSMRAAISVLADSQGEYKAAILGDMLELGPFSPALHAEVGEYLGKVGIQCLIAVGEQSESIAQSAQNSGVPEIYYCQNKEEAEAYLPGILRAKSTILIKASRGMKLEELTDKLLEMTSEE